MFSQGDASHLSCFVMQAAFGPEMDGTAIAGAEVRWPPNFFPAAEIAELGWFPRAAR
jgi:hypothetical protein